MRPDLIVTQAQCEVCAVSLVEVGTGLQSSTAIRARVVSLSPTRLADLWTDMATVAKAIGLEDAGRTVSKGLKSRAADVIEKTAGLERRPSVACLEWLDPLMAAGNWVPELVDLAGGLELFGTAGKHSPWLNWEAVREHDPEFLIAMPCGFNLERTRREMGLLTTRADWAKLRAVRKGRVFVTDGNQYFNRPGPRLVDSLEILGEILYPELFKFGYEGRAYRS